MNCKCSAGTEVYTPGKFPLPGMHPHTCTCTCTCTWITFQGVNVAAYMYPGKPWGKCPHRPKSKLAMYECICMFIKALIHMYMQVQSLGMVDNKGFAKHKGHLQTFQAMFTFTWHCSLLPWNSVILVYFDTLILAHAHNTNYIITLYTGFYTGFFCQRGETIACPLSLPPGKFWNPRLYLVAFVTIFMSTVIVIMFIIIHVQCMYIYTCIIVDENFQGDSPLQIIWRPTCTPCTYM